MWSVRGEVAKDLGGTLKRVADMGYDGVEFFGEPSVPADVLRTMLGDLGLTCCGWHVGFAKLQDDQIESTVAFHKVLGNPYLIVPAMPGNVSRTRSDWVRNAEFFNRLAVRLARDNLRTGYHNHRSEFTPLEGDLPEDVLFGHADAGVILQLDIGHAAAAGADAVEVLNRYPGRATTVHVKPFSPRVAEQADVRAGYRPVLGEDELPWPEILSVCRRTGGTLWYIVEYESDAYSPMESLDRSLKALRAM
jgi:sugar phosphate isomerase/epimerase